MYGTVNSVVLYISSSHADSPISVVIKVYTGNHNIISVKVLV